MRKKKKVAKLEIRLLCPFLIGKVITGTTTLLPLVMLLLQCPFLIGKVITVRMIEFTECRPSSECPFLIGKVITPSS